MRFPRMILLACAAPLLAMTACTTISAPVSDRVERASTAYYATKPMVDLLVSLMPPAYAARIIAWQAIAERALLAAKVATTAAEQLIELRKLEAARVEIATLTGPT